MKYPVKKHLEKEEREVNKIANKLVDILLNEGFIIQRYDAYSTNSIYLKLDYGVCNTIRISDHQGKQHLFYKWNLRGDISGYQVRRSNFTMYLYPFKNLERLVNDIKKDKEKKLIKYGSLGYKDIMNFNKEKNKNECGFWTKSYLVKKEVKENEK